MRADRLVATLLLLQAKQKVTAAEVAAELEISERTARRDLEALSVAGIPVYSQQGRGGGWSLIGGATTDLTGFRSTEARALLVMAAASGDVTPEFSNAIRKLVQALPAPMREEARRVTTSVLADGARWGNREGSSDAEPVRDHLEPLQQAVIERRQIDLTYNTPRKGVTTRRAHPLGLVTKRAVWYLLADTSSGQRSFRIDRIVHVVVRDEPARRPDDFDLERAWMTITAGYEATHRRFEVAAIVHERTIAAMRSLGVEVAVDGQRTDARFDVRVGGMNVQILAAELAGVMHGVELIDAPELEDALGVIGAGLVARFGRPG